MGLCIVPFFLPVENENICLSLFFYHISNSLWRLRSTDHFPVLLWGSGLSAVNALCPLPHFAVRPAVLINYFPSSGGIRFRPKRSHGVVSGAGEVPGICFWPLAKSTSPYHCRGRESWLSWPSCLPMVCWSVKIPMFLVYPRVFVSVRLGDVNWVSWRGGRCRVEAVIVASPLSPPSLLEWHALYLSTEKTLLLAPGREWVAG